MTSEPSPRAYADAVADPLARQDGVISRDQLRGAGCQPYDIERLLRRRDFESGRFTLAFVGYGNEESGAVLELTHNWDQAEPYVLGSAYGHIALSVRDAQATCDALLARGEKVPRPPGPMKHGGSVIAFVEDPDGYKVELIQRP